MNREEAIKELQESLDTLREYDIAHSSRLKQALEMAIQALSQEPCDDVVSRKAVLKLKHHKPEYGDMIYAFDVEQLPPVTPSRHVNCEIAEHDGNGCLGYSHYGDDFPIKECLHCPKYTSYEEE